MPLIVLRLPAGGPPMKRLDLYILRQIGVPALLAFAVISFIVLSNEIRDRAHDFAAFITLSDIAILMALLLPLLVSIIVPMTFLIGVMLTFGRLAQQHEIAAMQAAGVSLKRLAVPVIITGALLSAACFFIQDRLQPWAVSKAFHLIYSELPSRITLNRLQPGVMHEYQSWRVYFARRDEATDTLFDLDLVTPRKENVPPVYFHAKSATLQPAGDAYELVMTQGHIVTEQHVRIEFDEQRLTLPPPSTFLPGTLRKMQRIDELLALERDLLKLVQAAPSGGYTARLHKLRQEIADRWSLPFAAFACAMAGAPIAVRAERRGRSHMFAAASVLAVGYVILYMMAQPATLRPLAEVVVRTWLPNLALIGVGLVLFFGLDRVAR